MGCIQSTNKNSSPVHSPAHQYEASTSYQAHVGSTRWSGDLADLSVQLKTEACQRTFGQAQDLKNQIAALAQQHADNHRIQNKANRLIQSTSELMQHIDTGVANHSLEHPSTYLQQLEVLQRKFVKLQSTQLSAQFSGLPSL